MFDVPSCVSGKEREHYLAIETYLHIGAQYDHLEPCVIVNKEDIRILSGI